MRTEITYIALAAWTSMCLAGAGIIGHEWGKQSGKALANKQMWDSPPNMAWCRVFPDGGKRCEKEAELAPKPLIECLRMCRIQERMSGIKK